MFSFIAIDPVLVFGRRSLPSLVVNETLLTVAFHSSHVPPSLSHPLSGVVSARERIVGWYHTGPKLHHNDMVVHQLLEKYCNNPVSEHYFYYSCFIVQLLTRN